MTYPESVVLGVVQGLTEFLPISSSAHLIVVPWLFGWPDQGLAFDAVMHLGTLGALLAYFRVEIVELLTGAVDRRLAAILLVATIPGGLAGVALNRWVETNLRSPMIVVITTALWAVAMWLADRRASPPPRASGDPLHRVSWGQGLVIGVAQALALIPGTSRSGVTITTALAVGLDRATAARYSFMLGIPITAAAGGYKLLHAVRGGLPAGERGPLLVAVVVALLSGWFAVWFLVNYLKRGSLLPFVVYRLALAAVLLAILLRS